MKALKSLLVVVFLMASAQIQATHVAGSELSYEHVPGHPSGQLYRIVLRLYRDGSPFTAGLPNTQTVTISSSCYSTMTRTLTRTSQGPVPNLDECVDINNAIPIELHVYRGFVIMRDSALDQNGIWQYGNVKACTNGKIAWNLCCRNNAIDNLVGPGGTSGYNEVVLNNTNGPNSSPQFITPAAKAFCNNNYFIWSQAATEADGDSVRYTLAPALDFGAVPIPYATNALGTPYSFTNPMTTVGPLVIDEKTGTYYFTTGSVQEICVVVIKVEEYRYNNTLSLWQLVGTSTRDMQVIIASTCKLSVQDGPKINTNLPGFTIANVGEDTLKGPKYNITKVSNDSVPDPNNPGSSIYQVPIITYPCVANSIDLQFDVPIFCESIDPTDFRLIGPDQVPRPIISINSNCNVTASTSTITLNLYKPLTVNGQYALQIKKGNDGNTLTNNCGFELSEFYTMLFQVDNCFYPYYELRNVTVEENTAPRVEWLVDTATFPPQLFSKFEMWRSGDNGASYQLVDFISDYTVVQDTGSWLDFTRSTIDVNAQEWMYQGRLFVNDEPYYFTNSIHSILLDTASTNPSQFNFVWSAYNGWAGPQYKLYRAELGANPLVWTEMIQAGLPTLDTFFTLDLPSDTGCFAFKVVATNPADPTNAYASESNWITYCKTLPPPPPVTEVVVPNVFTPNGDMINDYFIIQGIESYSSSDLVVYNRWGTVVFEASPYSNLQPWDGTNRNSGSALPDGVYYYVLKAENAATGDKIDRTGNVHLLHNGGSN
jgi:gliding motility-associated-like protein